MKQMIFLIIAACAVYAFVVSITDTSRVSADNAVGYGYAGGYNPSPIADEMQLPSSLPETGAK